MQINRQMNHLIKLRGERDVIRLRNSTEDKRAFRRVLTSADRKIKLKKVVFVTFLTVFSAIFGFRPIRTIDLIEINDQKLAPFNYFCRSPAYLLHRPLLKTIFCCRRRSFHGMSS